MCSVTKITLKILTLQTVCFLQNKQKICTSYECAYVYWATDLLPHEFNESDIKSERNKDRIYVCGTNYHTPNKEAFIKAAQKRGIQFIQNDCWNNPISFDDN